MFTHRVSPAELSLALSIVFLTLSPAACGNQITVNFSATYTAATCTLTAPATVSFNQGQYSNGVPNADIGQGGITQTFNLTFSDCKNISYLSTKPKITVSGNVVSLGSDKLFANTSGAENAAAGYGIKLAVVDNALFQSANNLAEDGNIVAKTGTTVDGLELQSLPMRATLSCASEDCSANQTRHGGDFTTAIIFRLSYE